MRLALAFACRGIDRLMLFTRLVIALHVAGVIALIALAASNIRT